MITTRRDEKPWTRALSEGNKTIIKMRHEVAPANQKIDILEKLVEDLRADTPSLVLPTLDSKVAAYEAEELEVKNDILRKLKGEIKVEKTSKFKDDIKTEFKTGLTGDLNDMKRIKKNVDDNMTSAVKNLQEKISDLQ